MKLSVIVPIYNVSNYIEKCLDSLVNQTLNDIEIILVNDGSKENEEELIKPYLEKYKNIKYLKKENGGLSSARNYGIKHASGKYIAFLDSDDYIESSMFLEMYNQAIKTKSDIVVCQTKKVYDDKEVIIKASFNLTNDYKDYLLSVPMACNKIYKRSLFEEPFLFKENIWYEDLELIPSLILKTNKITFLEKPFYNYLQREGSITNQDEFNIKILDILKVLESLEERFKKYKRYAEYKEEIEYLYIEHLLYSTSLKIAKYRSESKKYFKEFNKLLNTKFPNWKDNKYLKKKSFKFKLVVKLTSLNMIKLIEILDKMR